MNLPAEIRRLNKRITVLEKLLNIQEVPQDYLKCVEQFFRENCQLEHTAKVEAKVLYNSFVSWLKQKRIVHSIGSRTFYDCVRSLNYEVRRGSKNIVHVYGVSLKLNVEY
jgi:hypothetical protein